MSNYENLFYSMSYSLFERILARAGDIYMLCVKCSQALRSTLIHPGDSLVPPTFNLA